MPNWFEQLTEPVQDVIRAAQEVVNDFENFGEVLQTGDGGEYDETSPIGRLTEVLNSVGG